MGVEAGQIDADCVIVGGGIGGAVLALSLGRAGRRVIILERETSPVAVGRPEILAEATMQVFGRLGVREIIEREAVVVLEGLQLFEAGGHKAIFSVSAEELLISQARPCSTDPAATRRLLLQAAEQTGQVQIKRGVEVLDLERHGARVVGVRVRANGGPSVFEAPLVVGDDGTKSRIRSAIGATIALQDFPFDFLGAVVPQLPGQPANRGQAWVNFGGIRRGLFGGLFLPIPQGRTAMVFFATPQAADGLLDASAEAFQAQAAALSPLCADPSRLPPFPKGLGRFRRPYGLASRYVADGVALMGDAAHPVTPAGGQGANSSIADAAVLADVALEALKVSDCSARRLARYEAVRRPANERSLEFSRQPGKVFRTLQSAPWLSPLLYGFLRYVDGRQALKQRFLGSVARAFTSSALASNIVGVQ